MPEGPEVVVDLTSADVETFDTEYMKEHQMVLLEMFAPWCGHCKAFAPHYEQAARELKETFPNVTIAKVDATVNEAMGEKFGIEGYPTVKWIEYVEGGSPKVSDFPATPDADAIISFIKKRAGSPVTTLPSDPVDAAAALKEALTPNQAVVVVAFFPTVENSADFKLYTEAARQVDGPHWMYTTDPGSLTAAAPFLGASAAAFSSATAATAKAPVIALVRRGADNARDDDAAGTIPKVTAVPYVGELDDDTQPLVDFVKLERLPHVIPFTEQNIEMIFESSVKTQVLLFATPEQHKEAASYYEDVAAKYRGEYIFVSVILDGDENSIGVAEYFGVLPESDQEAEEEESLEDADTAEAKANALLDDFKPVAFIFFAPDEIDPVEKSAEEEEDPVETTDQRPKKWKLEEELSQASLEKFIESHKVGTLKEFFKSEEIPTEQKGPVTVVVGNNVDDIVMDPTKDVLVEVYAPWCQHCKALEPIYEKLARRFSVVDSVVIAKMDGTKNEHPLFADVEGFPAIFFFPASESADKEKVAYPEDQPRTLLGFTKWLKANAKVPYELKKKADASKAEL